MDSQCEFSSDLLKMMNVKDQYWQSNFDLIMYLYLNVKYAPIIETDKIIPGPNEGT